MKKNKRFFLAVLVIALVFTPLYMPTSRIPEKNILLGNGIHDTRMPYPESYMKAHEIKSVQVPDKGVKNMNVSSTLHYSCIPYEALIGLNLSISGNMLKMTYFDHSSDKDTFLAEITASQSSLMTNQETWENSKKFKIKWHESRTVDLTQFKSDLIAIRGEGRKNHRVWAYIKKTNGEYLIYSAKHKTYHLETEPALNPKDPEFLDMSKLTYPTSGKYNRCVHVKQWSETAKDIIYKDDLSDEFKLYLLLSYFAKQNMAYDKWGYGERADKIPGPTGDGFEYDKNFLYYSHVGVCFDYTNALVIMCRSIGLPATSLDSYKAVHTIAYVYLNLNNGEGGKWVAIDPTDILRYNCVKQDTDPAYFEERYGDIGKCYDTEYFQAQYYNTQIWQGN